MADSFVQYTASGSTDTFSIPFGYLDPTHVFVELDGVDTAFTFPSGSQAQITSGNPVEGVIVKVFRVTPRDTRQVVWQNAANLTADDLNTSDLQFLYITQEAFDEAANSLKKDSTGIFDATSIRIQNVATPTASGDATNKTYVDTALAANVAAVEAFTDLAEAAAVSAAADAVLTAADVVATNADVVTTNADVVLANAAAAQAASSAAEGLYNDVITITFADSPYVPSLAQEGTLFRCDTSGGDIVVNLSELAATYGEDMKFAFVKTTGDANTITVNRGGSDTIDGGTSEVISDQYVITVIVGDSASSAWISAVQSSGVADGVITTPKLADNSVTLAKLAGGTAGNLITFDTNGDPEYVVTGSSGQVLTSNGTGNAPTMQDAAGGGWIPIKTITASSDSTIDFVNGSGGVVLDGTYKAYAIVISSGVPSVDGAQLRIRTSSDVGVSFDSGASDYANSGTYQTAGGVVSVYGGTDPQVVAALGLGNATGENFGGIIYLFNPAASARFIFRGQIAYTDSGGTSGISQFSGVRLANADVDAFRLYPDSGNITSGTFTLYGLKGA